MEVLTFIAASAADAVTQIRERLGPEAVVLNVRKLPVGGLSGLWQAPRIEVLACRPQTVQPQPVFANALAELKQELAAIRERVDSRPSEGEVPLALNEALPIEPSPEAKPDRFAPRWRVGLVLESTGLLPLHAQRVVDTLRARHGDQPPESLGEQIQLAKAVLREAWRGPSAEDPNNIHVFIGPPGVGKTSCLCQWLARETLLQGRRSSVWRLDGRRANNAESLSVYAEILGVRLERFIPERRDINEELLFIDLPGVNWMDEVEMRELGEQLKRLPPGRVHLVLNAAYEIDLLLAQVRAFARFSPSDLIFTHLDEEQRWGKLWNFVLGTNYGLGFLSTGQNVPGDFETATADSILARQFLRK